jgi:GntR family transcriptional regulator, rspAB operon transcriptional repressor
MELIKINRQFGENTKHYIYRVLKMNIMTLNIKPGTGISEAEKYQEGFYEFFKRKM